MTETDLEPLNDSVKHGIPRRSHPELCRALAEGTVTRASLARQYGVTRAAITYFAKAHAAQVEEIKAHLDDDFAGLWIARKEQRVAAYMADYEMSLDHPRASHFEHVRVRTQILTAVAEELGQLPPRMQVTVMPVVHVIEGVDLSDLR